MGYSDVALEDKILEMYPEIRKHGISVNLTFDKGENATSSSSRRIRKNLPHTLKRRTPTTV
jgi:hypothetical protein